MIDANESDDTLSVEDETEDDADHPGPVLFVVFRADQVFAAPRRFNLADVDEVLFGRGEEPPQLDGRRLRLSLSDRRMSLSHARLRRTNGGRVLEDLGSKNGTFVNRVQIAETILSDGDVVELAGTFLIFRDINGADDGGPESILGVETLCPKFAHQLRQARNIARSAVPLLLLGETGTGKEVVARSAHAESGRRGPIVAVNCAALPATLVESELFGTKKGAFSGADADRGGVILAAHRGTLFLDEIGELPMPAQAALLRVLQDGEVTPVGGTKPLACDVRIISATNRDVSAVVRAGQFRPDLYARLAGFRLELLPLRKRKQDLGLLVASLLRRLAPERAATTTFSLSAARRIFQHDWPLNVRELEKALSAALVLSTSRIEEAHLQLASLSGSGGSPARSEAIGRPVPRSPEHDARRQLLGELLERHGGNISAVAREMGKERLQIRRWIRIYQLSKKP